MNYIIQPYEQQNLFVNELKKVDPKAVVYIADYGVQDVVDAINAQQGNVQGVLLNFHYLTAEHVDLIAEKFPDIKFLYVTQVVIPKLKLPARTDNVIVLIALRGSDHFAAHEAKMLAEVCLGKHDGDSFFFYDW
jgi:hypothetical protein